MSQIRSGMEFWFEFASTYSYLASMRIQALCRNAGVELTWIPFSLGPLFALQGWNTSPFNLNPLRGAYMWRDMERLTQKFGLLWKRPEVFPKASALAARVAAAYNHAPWLPEYVRAIYEANFFEDADISDEAVVSAALVRAGADAQSVMHGATQTDLRNRLRENTERAIQVGIFGAPNCLVGEELFWGEETLEDAVAWAGRNAR